jgi:hypothetical protein
LLGGGIAVEEGRVFGHVDGDDVGAGEQLLHRHRLRVQLAWAVPLFLAGIDAEDSNAARDIPHMDTL